MKDFTTTPYQNKKPPESGYHVPDLPHEQKVEVGHLPPMNGTSTTLAVPVPSGGEFHPFMCFLCKTGISAEQRSATVEEYQKALCENCAAKFKELPPETKKKSF